MDNLPLMIIRGIGDYTNSHKEVRWQAFAAAAFARGFLDHVQPEAIEAEPAAINTMYHGMCDFQAMKRIAPDEPFLSDCARLP